jgi:hypothetical protein
LFEDNGIIICFDGLKFKDSPPSGYRFVKVARNDMGAVFEPIREQSTRTPQQQSKEYTYYNADGQPYQLVKRYYQNGKKKFAQSHWNGQSWQPGLPKGFERIPYRLPEVQRSQLVGIVEGEKDCETARASGLETELGIVFTTNPEGAGKWTQGWGQQHFASKNVIIFPDNDAVGFDHARQIYQDLLPHARSLAIIQLPSLPEKGDLTDFLESGGTVVALSDLVKQASNQPDQFGLERLPTTDEPKTCSSSKFADKETEEKPKRQNQASLLVELAKATGVELFHTPDGDSYADIWGNGARATHKLRSKGFRDWLNYLFFQEHGKTASSQAMQDALNTLDGMARFDGPEILVHVRLAEHQGAVYLDLGTPDWMAIAISAEGWQIVAEPPVRFRRPKGMLPLPMPEQGGNLSELKQVLNLAADDWVLVLSWLSFCFFPTHPHPLLILHGEQGSGKSFMARVLKGLIDPGKSPLQSEPRELRDLAIAAHNRWVLCFDNLSGISTYLSDALCRIATGGGFITRTLHTNDEETIFEFTRPIILTGIDSLATRGDLLERSLLINLPAIPENQRLDEAELQPQLERFRPRILGAMLTAVSQTLKVLPATKPSKLPRMADFAKWAIAGEAALGLPPGSFEQTYGDNRATARETALESSPVAVAIQHLMESRSVWEGTASELLADLEKLVEERTIKSRRWASNANALGKALKRLAPDLRGFGIEVSTTKTSDGKKRLSRLEKVGKISSVLSDLSAEAQNGKFTSVSVTDKRTDNNNSFRQETDLLPEVLSEAKANTHQELQPPTDQTDNTDSKKTTCSKQNQQSFWYGFKVSDRVQYIGSNPNYQQQYSGILPIAQIDSNCAALRTPEGYLSTWLPLSDLKLAAS